ncbi:MAG: hypothetical protein MUP16_00915 [Sedimentisphaerales bacterium]|nr:hypothetical protein [Sedimentisphaerales bacterium]
MILAVIDPFTWYIIWTLVSIGISYGIAQLTKKDPKDIRYEPDTFDFPEIREGTKFPIIAGTCWIEAPVVAWSGDIKTESLGVRLSDSGGQYVYINKYSYGAHHILTQGFNDGVVQVKVGDLVIWPNSADKTALNADAAASAIINLPELYGGIHEHDANITGQGGIAGTVDFQYGLAAQTLNSYLESVQGSGVSCNRGLTAAILRQVYVGMSTQPKQWKYLVKRTAHLTTGEDQWYPAKATIRNYEINPIHWLREIYTDTEWGLCNPTSIFDDAKLRTAADVLYDEGFGMCIKWEADQSLEDHVKDILRYINAVIREDHSTGQTEIKLIRNDYTLGLLEVFDETDINTVEDFSRGTIHKVPDVTYVKYWNLIDNLPVSIPNHDMALVSAQNEMLIPNNVDYTAVVNDGLGGQLAARDQHQISAFPATMKIKAKRTMSHLMKGDVFKMAWPPLGIVSMVIRVVTAHYGTLADGEVSFDCVEDIFGMKDSLYAAPPSTGWDSTVDDPAYDDEHLVASVALSGVDPTVVIT